MFKRLRSAANVLFGYTSGGKVIVTTNSDLPFRVTEAQARGCSIFNSSIAFISNQIASIHGSVYERTENGREKRADHRAARLLKRPSPYCHRYRFFQVMQTHALATGNAYAFIDWNSFQLRILDPHEVEPKFSSGALIYEHRVSGQQPLTLQPYEVIHIHRDSWDGIKGESPVCQYARQLGMTLAAEDFAGRYWKNGTHIGGILENEGTPKKEDRKEQKESFEEAFGGLDNAGKIAYLYGGTKFTPLTVDAEKAQLLETREWQKKEIASDIFHLPLWTVGLAQTPSNWEEASVELIRRCLQPICEQWEAELNWKLFQVAEYDRFYYEFDFATLERGAHSTVINSMNVERQMGSIKINEVREKLNRPGIGPAGDLVTQPLNTGLLLPNGQIYTPTATDVPAPNLNPNTLAKMSAEREATERKATTKENNAIKRAAKKHLASGDQSGYRSWSKDFLAKHRDHLIEVFEPILEADELDNYIEQRLQDVKQRIALELLEENEESGT